MDTRKIIALHEDPAPAPAPAPVIDPASVVINGAPADRGLPPNTQPAAAPVATHASAALAVVPDTRLTNFAVGYPQDEIGALAEFMAPSVPAPLKFDYLVRSKTNAYGTVGNDLVGIGGLPPVVTFDTESTTSAVLQNRGLETQMDDAEEKAFDAAPGWSAALEWEDRLAMLLDWQRRGRLQRVIAAAAAAAGSATGKTWNAAANPISDLFTEIETIALLAGGVQNVRLVFGRTAWSILKFQAKVAGGTDYTKLDTVSKQRIADMLEVPIANIMVTYLQVTSSAQGVTAATTDLFTAAEIYIFAALSSPNRRSPDFMKRFYMPFNGQGQYVYAYQPHPLVRRKGTANYEHIAVTNSAAVKRLTIASS